MKIESAAQESCHPRSNILKPVKWSLLAGGTVLALYGASRKSPWSIGLGAATGLAAALAVPAGDVSQGSHFNCSFIINCSPPDAYNYWRNFERLPSFMRHLQSVKDLGNGRSEWIARGPLERPVRWVAEIEEDVQSHRISWRSVPSLSDFQIRGTVEFNPATGNRGTIVEASLEYTVPGGAIGKLVSKLFGKTPQFAIREDLRRFKTLIEAGEIPTTQGQPHGPRSKLISAVHSMHPQRIEPSATESGFQPAELRAS